MVAEVDGAEHVQHVSADVTPTLDLKRERHDAVRGAEAYIAVAIRCPR
jgi:hypothetical protein